VEFISVVITLKFVWNRVSAAGEECGQEVLLINLYLIKKDSMTFFKRFLGLKKSEVETKISRVNPTQSNNQLISDFITMSDKNRIGRIIICAETGQSDYYNLLKYAILNDNNINVKFAALKRLHLFKDNIDLIPFLKDLQLSEGTTSLEPYFSMALSRVGLISIEDLKKRMSSH
jgi:hypothetical protein